MTLEAVPKHAIISRGDTIVTSGFSNIFPAELLIGTIENFEVQTGRSNYTIQVKLNNDPSKEKYVYIILNKNRDELEMLNEVTQ